MQQDKLLMKWEADVHGLWVHVLTTRANYPADACSKDRSNV
jgi:hypothetical protein